ncbi:LysR substrate-binding domain-containing protein [Undibacterium sp. TS12]|uniref:LysR substrate-binding domain-containing protein n=1 Tax=Undibacterium sp. TS12 TaxID=2908202 RepID=UPI001F4C9921|nr:LysR substrate-binding domain-containing protein [Undibacterium sp. TS12]MCH8617730.1 LysR substrate-binding domain-containing protein [Undibacterium sp. TS12]
MLENIPDWLIFVKVVQHGSFTAGSASLALPTTTVSRRVRQLEQRLGVQLLHRTTRRLGLTEAGTVYFQHCEPMLDMIRQAETAVQQLQGKPRGLLKMTAPFSVMVNLIGPLLAEFNTLYPEVTIDVALSHQVQDLVSKEVDVALRLGPLPDSSLAARRLGILSNRIFASPAYLERHGEPSHPDELIHHRTLTTRVALHGDTYAWSLGQDGPGGANSARLNYPIKPVIVADDPEVLKAPLFGGTGLMLATDLIMARHVSEGLVRPVLPAWTGRCPELHAVFPKARILPAKLRVFIDFLVRHMNESIR